MNKLFARAAVAAVVLASMVGATGPARAERSPAHLDAENVLPGHYPNDAPDFMLRVHTNLYNGQRIDMSALGVPLCTARADRIGLAMCGVAAGTPEWLRVITAFGYDAVFAGDEYSLPASGHGALLEL